MKLRKLRIALCIALVVLLAVAAFSGCKGKDKTADKPGENSFIFKVTFADGHEDEKTISTDEETVGAALLKEGLIAGDESSYGLMITCVMGEAASWEDDQAYWAFYINGEYAVTGADATPIENGATYSFVYTKG